jgi:hypothetical protein
MNTNKLYEKINKSVTVCLKKEGNEPGASGLHL